MYRMKKYATSSHGCGKYFSIISSPPLNHGFFCLHEQFWKFWQGHSPGKPFLPSLWQYVNRWDNLFCYRNVQPTDSRIIPFQIHCELDCNAFIEPLQSLKIGVPFGILKNLPYTQLTPNLHCIFWLMPNNLSTHSTSFSIATHRVETKPFGSVRR